MLCRPLFPVAGFPVIGHTLNWLREGGIRTARVCANGDTAALRRCFGGGDPLGLTLHYVEDQMPRGPAGCVRDAMACSSAEVFVVVEGTVLPQVSLPELLAVHRGSGAALTVVAADPDPARRGGEPRLEPTGIYVVSRAALAHVPTSGFQDIKEALIPRLYAAGHRVKTHAVASAATLRVTNAASYIAVSKWAVERLCAGESAPEGYVRIQEALIHESARLHATARFIGPVLIGPQCRIEEDVIVIGPTSLGAGCLIGRQAVVSRCVLWTSCCVGAGAVLDHCVLADAARVGDEKVLRETVCLARTPRWTWLDRIRSGWRRNPKRGTADAPMTCPALPGSGRPRPSSVVVRSDLKRTGVSPAASTARKGDR